MLHINKRSSSEKPCRESTRGVDCCAPVLIVFGFTAGMAPYQMFAC